MIDIKEGLRHEKCRSLFVLCGVLHLPFIQFISYNEHIDEKGEGDI